MEIVRTAGGPFAGVRSPQGSVLGASWGAAQDVRARGKGPSALQVGTLQPGRDAQVLSSALRV